jgi:hypothetical protein
MQSGKQKRATIMARRLVRKQAAEAALRAPVSNVPPRGAVRVQTYRLARYSSYDRPAFVERGYYQDLAFTCRDCGAHQVWTAEQQQWWYETAGGYVYSTAVRCLTCRRERRLAHGGTPKKLRA